MPASRSRTRDATNLLTSTPDEAVLTIACALLTARDLLSLCLVCRRFNIKCMHHCAQQRPRASGSGQRRLWGCSGSAGVAVHHGGCGAAVGVGVQRAGARVGTALQP